MSKMKHVMVILIALIPLLTGCAPGPKLQSEVNDITCVITLGFTGDVMLGRLVNEKINAVGDYAYPWGNMLASMRSADLMVINLETTLTTSEDAVPKVFNFKADPDKVKTLQEGSIDVVSLANNHSLDFGPQGLIETLEVLDKAGIKHVGAGKNIQEARKPAIVEVQGLKIAIIGYTDNEPDWLAGDTKPGTYYIEIGDIETVKKDIDAVRENVDLIILTLHWGPNRRERPTKEFIDFARAMVDAGADIIHGHSAHIYQAIEIYKNKLIMYDCGDFVDDYAVYPDLRNDRSFLYMVEIQNKHLVRLRLIPVLISDMQVNKAKGDDFTETIERLKMLCHEFGTEVESTTEGAQISIS